MAEFQLNQAARQLRKTLELTAAAAVKQRDSSGAEAARQRLQCVTTYTVQLAQCRRQRWQRAQFGAVPHVQILQLWWQRWQLFDVLALNGQVRQVPASK